VIYPQNGGILKSEVSGFLIFCKVLFSKLKNICPQKLKISPQNYANYWQNNVYIKMGKIENVHAVEMELKRVTRKLSQITRHRLI